MTATTRCKKAYTVFQNEGQLMMRILGGKVVPYKKGWYYWDKEGKIPAGPFDTHLAALLASDCRKHSEEIFIPKVVPKK